MIDMDINIDLSQFNDFEKKMQKLPSEFRAAVVHEITQTTAQSILKNTQKNTPVDTGTLRRGWRTEINDIPNGYEIEISNSVEYAPYVEYGHRARGGKSFVKGQYPLTNAMLDARATAHKVAIRAVNKFFKKAGF